MKTIANIIHTKKFPLKIRDDYGNVVYGENLNGWWVKYKFEDNGTIISIEDSWGDSWGDLEDHRQ